MSDLVLTQRDGTIVTLTLNRADKLNALTKATWQQLGQVASELSQDESVRCIVLRGAGERAFSPGNDIGEFENDRANSAMARAYGEIHHQALAALSGCRHPVVAMIHGICVGGGLEIASLCDLRICGESSRFGVPIKRLGLNLGLVEMQGLRRLAGRATTLELLLEGRIFDAAEAYQKGLVSRVVPDDQVEREAYLSARRIAEGAPLVARNHKRFMQRLEDATPLTADEVDEAYACYDTRDFQIGYRSFLQKSQPQFEGR